MKKTLLQILKNKLVKAVLVFSLIAGVSSVIANVSATGCQPRVPGGECDSNAIVAGGVPKNQIAGLVANLDSKGKSAFAHAGIPGTCSYGSVVTGSVTRDNRVVVNGQTVATNAYTYGRQYIAPSTQIPGGAYMRQPSVSFRSSSITSWVCMEGKEFKWAVISTCGNPVKATPKHRNLPRLTIHKTTNKTMVEPGETFNYSITVRNTGNVALRNVVVADVLPAGLTPVNLNPGVRYNPNTRKITWPTYANMPVNTQFTKTFKVKVNNNAAAGSYRNIACVITNWNPNTPICDDVTVTVKKPKLKIVKTVSPAGPFDLNEEFTYTIKVTNIGKVVVKNAVITDTLPAGVVAVDNPNDRTVSFNILSISPGVTKSYSFKAKVVDPFETYDKSYVNTACADSPTTPKVCDDVTVKIKKPKYTCDALNVYRVGDKTFKFAVDYTALNGATLKNFTYNYGDGNSVTTTNNPVEHTYAGPGKYDAYVNVTFLVNGAEKTVTSDNCKKTINIVQQNEPVYTCDALAVTHLGDLSYRFEIQTTALNGATVKNYWIDYGDGSNENSETDNTFDHTYAEPGKYKAQATVIFLVDGEEKVVTVENCAANINTEVPDYCTVPGKEHLPADHPDCKPDVPVAPPETPETPSATVLPDTGAGDIVGAFMAISFAGMLAYRFVWLRQYN